MNWNLLFVQNWIPIILFELYLNAWHFPTNFTTVLVSKSSKFCICSRNYGFFVNKECPLPTLYGELLGKADSAGNISEPGVYKLILLTSLGVHAARVHTHADLVTHSHIDKSMNFRRICYTHLHQLLKMWICQVCPQIYYIWCEGGYQYF